MPPSFTVHRVGNESELVVVIENFAADPGALRDDAATRAFAARDDHYPGIKAPAPDTDVAAQPAVLRPIVRDVFGADAIRVLDVCYSIVTAAPDQLALAQRLPHFDGLEPGGLALMHYLVPGGCDGTSFYRHRATGFETIDHARSTPYFAQLNADMRSHGQPPRAYLNGNTQTFECIGHFEGHYNCALVYRGNILHSGAISAESPLSVDPRTGRLTITGFF
ncbi:MAG: hypothetical protein H7268_11630 [Sandarakinorhabdus sp.]|nr:hypothetical protein [Sandarakinorhabdus sp.]